MQRPKQGTDLPLYWRHHPNVALQAVALRELTLAIWSFAFVTHRIRFKLRGQRAVGKHRDYGVKQMSKYAKIGKHLNQFLANNIRNWELK